MKGLLYKDFSTIWNAYKMNFIFILLIYGILAYAMDMNFFLYMLVFILSMYACSILSFDEASHWDVYACTLPVKPGQLVASKYISGLILMGFGFVLALGMSCIVGLRSESLSEYIGETTAGCCAILIVSMLYISLMLPPSWKFGSAKARNYAFPLYGGVALLLLGIGTSLLPQAWKEQIKEAVSRITPLQLTIAMIAAFAVCVALYITSWAVSTAIYRRKEF